MKRNRKKYNFAFKEKAVLLSYERNCLSELEKELCLYPGALSQWRREYEKYDSEDGQQNFYLKSNIENQKIKELEGKIQKSDLKFEILKNAGKYLSQEKTLIFYFMYNYEKKYSIKLLCETLDVSTKTYRAWKNQSFTKTQERKILMQKEITSIFFAAKQRYGRERITAELRSLGYEISYSTVNKYMKELGLSDKVKKN